VDEKSVGHPARKEHWETVYRTKPLESVGWYQPVPRASLELIEPLGLPPDARVIDVGGGDSFLSDQLLKIGYTDLTVLDISGAALRRARERHGSDAEKICWVESDVLEFTPDRTYCLWHDRATFHFLTKGPQIKRYLEIAHRAIRPGGYLILGTFSDKGPPTCSGLPVQRYSIARLEGTVNPFFKMIRGINLDHQTPSGGIQAYTFGLFERVG
jgi:ubiquinone/menaquinone biosynthesis C-methylase UbiE